MRTLKILLLALILVVVVVLSLANRGDVTLHLLPADMATVMPLSIEVPLFVVSLVSIVVGMVVGYLLEWLREHKHRRNARVKGKEAAKLQRDMQKLRKEANKPEDEVLALIGH